jgi:hypothetical protein
MYYIGLDVHKKAISYCVKDASGQVHQEGQIGATRWELDGGRSNQLNYAPAYLRSGDSFRLPPMPSHNLSLNSYP